MQTEYANNGVRYKWCLAGCDGAGFVVFQDKNTDEQLKEAIKEIRNSRDVVWIHKATREDIIEDFWGKVFLEAELGYQLTWRQIERNDNELWKCIQNNISAIDYVSSKAKEWASFKISQ